MATMQQVGTAIREFTQEFKCCTHDAVMAKVDAKVQLVLALNQDTLSCLDAYVTMRGGEEMAHLENVQDGLHRVPYVQKLAYLK